MDRAQRRGADRPRGVRRLWPPRSRRPRAPVADPTATRRPLLADAPHHAAPRPAPASSERPHAACARQGARGVRSPGGAAGALAGHADSDRAGATDRVTAGSSVAVRRTSAHAVAVADFTRPGAIVAGDARRARRRPRDDARAAGGGGLDRRGLLRALPGAPLRRGRRARHRRAHRRHRRGADRRSGDRRTVERGRSGAPGPWRRREGAHRARGRHRVGAAGRQADVPGAARVAGGARRAGALGRGAAVSLSALRGRAHGDPQRGGLARAGRGGGAERCPAGRAGRHGTGAALAGLGAHGDGAGAAPRIPGSAAAAARGVVRSALSVGAPRHVPRAVLRNVQRRGRPAHRPGDWQHARGPRDRRSRVAAAGGDAPRHAAGGRAAVDPTGGGRSPPLVGIQPGRRAARRGRGARRRPGAALPRTRLRRRSRATTGDRRAAAPRARPLH
jgi:hypothetical protein